VLHLRQTVAAMQSPPDAHGCAKGSRAPYETSIADQLSNLLILEQEEAFAVSEGVAAGEAASLLRLPSTDSQRSPPASPFHQSPIKHDPPRESHAAPTSGCSPSPPRGDGSGHHDSLSSPPASRPAVAAAHVAPAAHDQVQVGHTAQEAGAAPRGAVAKAGRRLELGGLSSPLRSQGGSALHPQHPQQSAPAAACQRFDAAGGGGGIANYADDAADACQTPLPRLPLRTRPHDSLQHKTIRDEIGVDAAWSGERSSPEERARSSTREEPASAGGHQQQQEGPARAAARPRPGGRAGPALHSREHPSHSTSTSAPRAGMYHIIYPTQTGIGE